MTKQMILGVLLATAAWGQCSGTPDPRLWSGTYAGGTTYAVCDVVYYAGDAKAYVSIQSANTGHQPDISSTWWTVVYTAPVNLQSSDPLAGSQIALDYNLAWLLANSSGGASTNGTGGQALTSNGSGGFGTALPVGAAANDLVQLNSSGQLPAVSAEIGRAHV